MPLFCFWSNSIPNESENSTNNRAYRIRHLFENSGFICKNDKSNELIYKHVWCFAVTGFLESFRLDHCGDDNNAELTIAMDASAPLI